MNARRWITVLLLLDLLFTSATPELPSRPRQTGEDTLGLGQIESSWPDEGAGLAMNNPAAVYCVELGYEYQIVEQEDGSQNGVCLLPDGTTCSAWAFLRGQCGQEHSICARHGLETVVRSDGGDPFSNPYALCVDRRGRAARSATEMADLMAKTAGQAVRLPPGVRLYGPAPPAPDRPATGPDSAEPVPAGAPAADLPSSFDWRDHVGSDWMTPVKDQGICGSCWAFSAVGTLEAALNVDAGNPDLGLDLSEQYLVTDCHIGGSCSGGNGWSALNYIWGEGIPDEDCLPYRDGGQDGCRGCSLICTYRTGNCSDYRCSDRCANWSERLQTLSEIVYIPSDKAAIKEALIEHGPLSVWVSTQGQFGPDGIYRCEDNSSRNHLVVLVGWNDTPGYWILKNSWSTDFQDGGYYKVAYDTCAVQASVLAVRTELDDPGVSLVPPGATRRGAPGDSVVHPVWLVNHTGATTSFDLSLSGHHWPSFLSRLRTPSMADGESIRFDVHVTVPKGAVDGDADSVTVTAVSGDVTAGAASAAVYQDTSTFTTQARVLPKVEVSPATLDSTQTPGSTTTQALDLRNASASLLTFTIHQALPPDAALLLSLDETGPAGLFLDGSVRGNHAVCGGDACPQAGVSSPRGGAAQFDGQNDRVTAPVHLEQSRDSPGVTMMAGVYPTGTRTDPQYVISTDNGGSDWSLLRWEGNWHVMTGEAIRGTGSAVDVDRWQHVAAVFEPAMGSVRCYKDGEETHVRYLGYDASTNPVVLGDNASGRWEYFYEGQIDEVRVYERALSAEQIREIYHDSAGAPWLSWDVSRGRLQGPGTRTIQFALDASGLPLDTYTAQIAVVSDDPGQSRIDVPVTMVVSVPEIEVTPKRLEDKLFQGASLTRTLTLSNTGAPGLTYFLTRQAGAGWIQISPTEGTVPAGGAHEIAVTLDASASDLGEQSARIFIQSNDPLTPTLDVPVTMTVRAGFFLPVVFRSVTAGR